MRDRGTAADVNNEPALFLANLHERLVIKVTGVAEMRVDKDDRDLRPEPMPLSDGALLLTQAFQSWSVRYQHRKFQIAQRVPEHVRLTVKEIKTAETKLRTAQRAGQDR